MSQFKIQLFQKKIYKNFSKNTHLLMTMNPLNLNQQLNMKINPYIMVNGQKIQIKGMGEEFKFGLMEAYMKGIGKMMQQM